MRPLGCVLLCCLLLAGCRTAEPQPVTTPIPGTEAKSEPVPETPARASESRSRFELMREAASVHFFTGVEQVGKVVAFPFQVAMTGLYVLLSPVIGYGRGGPS